MKTLCRKLRGTAGETIAETLIAMLIVSLAFLMRSGGIVTAARLNRKAAEANGSFTLAGAETTPVEVAIVHGTHGSGRAQIGGAQGYRAPAKTAAEPLDPAERWYYYYYETP